MLFFFFLFALLTDAAISPSEAQLICKYAGVRGFPVTRCINAANACTYPGIECESSQSDPLWNETITGINVFLTFTTNTTDALPTELGNLLSLRSFELHSVIKVRNSTIPTQIGRCAQLASFNIAGLALGGTLPSELFSLQSLTYVELGGLYLTGTVPTTLSSQTSLVYLSLTTNRFSGVFPSLLSLTLLEFVDMENNFLSGEIPDASSLPVLRHYQVSNNRFHGDVPAFISPLLSFVDFSYNIINGTFSEAPFFYNASSVLLGTPLFITANANEIKGTIPYSLFSARIVTIDLSFNQLSGTIPAQAMRLCTSLEQVVFSHNTLTGSLSPNNEWVNHTFPSLFRLTLNNNFLNGSVPSFNMGTENLISVNYLPHIYLNLNDNAFSGSLPSFRPFTSPASLDFSRNALTLSGNSFGSGANISWLNMAYNPIKTLPSSVFTGLITFLELESLDLSFCQISGTLPKVFHAQYLKLNNNYFTGVVQTNFLINTIRSPSFADIRLNRLDADATRVSHIGSVSVDTDGEIVLTDFPQDVDECLLNTHACEYLCVDGWFPVPGYTCACPSGFLLDEVNKLNCSAVCGDGLLRWPEEECDYEFGNKLGCHPNCTQKEGYLCDATGCAPVCGDGVINAPEECDTTMPGCSAQCRVLTGFTCSLLTNTCQPCAQSWLPFIYPPNLRLFANLRGVIGDDLTDFNFASCVSCDDGYALQTRGVLVSEQCSNLSTQRSLPCSFACSNLSVFDSATESVFTLEKELLKNGFIHHLFRVIFNVNISLNSSSLKKRFDEPTSSEELSFVFSPCVSDKTGPISVLRALSLDIVPNLPALALEPTPCGATLRSTNPPASGTITIALVLGLAALFVVVTTLSCLLYYYRSSELHALPDDISWSFLAQRTHPWAWTYFGSQKSGYYSLEYDPKSEEYRRVESLLTTHFKKDNLQIAGITAVYNPTLSNSFINAWRLMTTRKLESPDLFFARTYTKDEDKMRVMEYYEKDLLQFTPYNTKLAVPIIPVLHGTDFTTAECIACTGFAALSSLDDGFFGKGIYFTTSLSYTLSYACAKRRPSVIISYVHMGNPFPVTEDHKGPKSLKGRAIKAGYNSHVVLTNKRGAVYDEKDLQDDVVCDEIVVAQESQILPAFIVELDIISCAKEFEKWNRSLPAPLQNGAILEFRSQQEIASKCGASHNESFYVSIDMTDNSKSPKKNDIEDI